MPCVTNTHIHTHTPKPKPPQHHVFGRINIHFIHVCACVSERPDGPCQIHSDVTFGAQSTVASRGNIQILGCMGRWKTQQAVQRLSPHLVCDTTERNVCQLKWTHSVPPHTRFPCTHITHSVCRACACPPLFPNIRDCPALNHPLKIMMLTSA